MNTETTPPMFPIKRGDFATYTPSAITLAERFWARVHKTDSCWVWTRSKHPKGYGWYRFSVKTRTVGKKTKATIRAHRLSWLLNRGEIPCGLSVLHNCDNPACVRPDHLFLGTIKDNYDDAVSKGRRIPGRNKGLPKHSARLPFDSPPPA